MAERIDITRVNPGTYGVEITEGTTTTSHRVEVSPDVLSSIAGSGVIDLELEETVVRESFEYLLEREPAEEILDEFKLSDISRYFPTYANDLAERVSQRS